MACVTRPPRRPASRASSVVHSWPVPALCAAFPPWLASSRWRFGSIEPNPRLPLNAISLTPLNRHACYRVVSARRTKHPARARSTRSTIEAIARCSPSPRLPPLLAERHRLAVERPPELFLEERRLRGAGGDLLAVLVALQPTTHRSLDLRELERPFFQRFDERLGCGLVGVLILVGVLVIGLGFVVILVLIRRLLAFLALGLLVVLLVLVLRFLLVLVVVVRGLGFLRRLL